ncbi:MAG: hypothetical protein A2V90_02220 [Gammaproteobacteria bacterium RBG_16_57_12]|nr:MAG: hypothetical protein A2V90_02220 [Gammaproteobacteria bacterium RBG_16_57_12]
MKKTLKFFYDHILLGLAIAFIALVLLRMFYPELLQQATSVVEVREAVSTPDQSITANARDSGPVSYSKAVKAAAPAVVNIYTTKVVTQRVPLLFDDPVVQKFFGTLVEPRTRRENSLGSGVIISPEGYVLTNNHVIQDADEILVALQDGRSASAVVVGNDVDTDLAVLKVDLPDLPSITLGRSGDLQVGDVVLAMGNPFGVGQTVTFGIISATGRTDLGISTFEDFIQTDAAINPGNSGGALVNVYGHLVGINTAIFSRSGGSQGIGFATPIDIAKEVLKQILAYGYVKRGWIGIDAQNLTPEIAETFNLKDLRGVIITDILRNGPAHLAGLRPGDIIVAINGQAVDNSKSSMNLVTNTQPGQKIIVTLLRGGQRHEVEVEVGQRPVRR